MLLPARQTAASAAVPPSTDAVGTGGAIRVGLVPTSKSSPLRTPDAILAALDAVFADAFVEGAKA
jgi:hypothetical protein